MSGEVEKYSDKDSFMKSFQDLYEKEYVPASWDDKTKAKVREVTKPSRTKTSMFASIPMKCYASRCVFADTCPLQKEGIAPEGLPCALEMAMVVQFMKDYMDQLQIDEDNLVETSMVRNLVDYEVQYLRASKYLAKESFIQENVIGIDSNGEVMLSKQLHLAVEMQDRMLKRQKETVKQLMASREQKAKVGMGALDTAQSMANLMADFRQIQMKAAEIQLEKLGMKNYDTAAIEAEVVDSDES